MNQLSVFKLLSSVAALALGVAMIPGCAGDTEEDPSADQASNDGTTGTSEDEIASAGGCKSKAQYIARANRICGPSNYSFQYANAVTRYRQGHDWKHCAPNFYIELPFTCK